MIGSATSEGRSQHVAGTSSSIGSSTNSAGFRLDPRGLLPLLTVLLLGEPPLVSTVSGGVQVRSEGGWMESRRTMSNVGAFKVGQSRYHPHRFSAQNPMIYDPLSEHEIHTISLQEINKEGRESRDSLEGEDDIFEVPVQDTV